MTAIFSTDLLTPLLAGPTTPFRCLSSGGTKRLGLGAGAGAGAGTRTRRRRGRGRGPHRRWVNKAFYPAKELELKRYVKEGKYTESVELLKELARNGFTPEDWVCARLVSGLFSPMNVSKAHAVVDIMETFGNPGPRVYSALILANVLANEIPRALRVFDRMVERGVSPDGSAYDFAVMALVQRGELTDAARLHEEMLRNGFEPNALNYPHLIEKVILGRGSDRFLKLWEEMASRGMQPDENICVGIAGSLCRQGNPDLGLEIFGKIEDLGFPLMVLHYDSVIFELWKNGNQVRSLQFALEMLDKGIGPSIFTYKMLIECLCKDGLVDEAIGLLLDMDRTRFRPDNLCYCCVIGGLCKHNRVNDAIEFLAAMVEKGYRPIQSTYRSLIQAVSLSGLKSEALHLANSLRTMNALSDDSIGWISKDAFP